MNKVFLAGMGFAVVVTLLSFGGGVATAAPTPFVTGGGSGIFPFTPFAGDLIDATVSARQLPDGSVQGRFNLVHHSASSGLVAHVAGDVTCLAVVGNTAHMTGVITQGEQTGQAVAITVIDNGNDDAIGIDLSFFPVLHPIGPCQAVVPYMPIGDGNFTVH